MEYGLLGSDKATVTWFLGPRVCLEPFLKSRGDGKIKKNSPVAILFFESGLKMLCRSEEIN